MQRKKAAAGLLALVALTAFLALGHRSIVPMWRPIETAVVATPARDRSPDTAARAQAAKHGADSTRAVESAASARRVVSLGEQSVPAPSGPVKPMLRSLQAAAEAGDGAAARQLYVALTTCRDALRRAEDYQDGGRERLPAGIRDGTRRTIAANLDHCAGVSAEDAAHAARWLEPAAKRGDRESRLLWVIALPDDMGPRWALQHPDEVVAYRQTARSYLEAMVRECVSDGVFQTYQEYRYAGVVEPIDPTMAYRYAWLFELMKPGILGWDLDRMRREIGNAEAARQQIAAESIFRSACG